MESLLREHLQPQESVENTPQLKDTRNKGTWAGLPVNKGLNVIWEEDIVQRVSTVAATMIESKGSSNGKSGRSPSIPQKTSKLSEAGRMSRELSSTVLKTAGSSQSVGKTRSTSRTPSKHLKQPSLSNDELLLLSAMQELSSTKCTAMHEAVFRSRNDVFQVSRCGSISSYSGFKVSLTP